MPVERSRSSAPAFASELRQGRGHGRPATGPSRSVFRALLWGSCVWLAIDSACVVQAQEAAGVPGAVPTVDGAAAQRAEAVVVERGPHHRVFERRVVEAGPGGRAVERVSRVTELGTGLHYWDGQQWNDTRAEFAIENGFAVVRRAQIQLQLAANANSRGAVVMLDPNGRRFVSHVVALAYTDYASGRSVSLAEPVDNEGLVTEPNRVIYPGALRGEAIADLRYTVLAGLVEQDVIVTTAPPPPEAWGLDPKTTRLEVFTEFIELPPARTEAVVVFAQADRQAAARMAEPDLVDERLDFGVVQFAAGRAFPIGDDDETSAASVPSGKSLETIEGRRFLIEKVEYAEVKGHLERLPQMAGGPGAGRGRVVEGRALLAAHWAPSRNGAPGRWQERQWAQAPRRPAAGLVLDYVAMNGSLTNQVFKAGETYFATNSVMLYGTTVLEGTSVLKVKGAHINYYGLVECRTGPARPFTVTSVNDNTIGQTVPGSTGTPGDQDGGHLMACRSTSGRYDIRDVVLRNGSYALTFYGGARGDVANAQLCRSYRGLSVQNNVDVTLRNVLFAGLNLGVVPGNASTARVEHATFHRVGSFLSSTGTTMIVTLTNSLLVAVTNHLVFQSGAGLYTNSSDAGVFQSVGGCDWYLSPLSALRDAGVTNINPALRQSLRTLTTFAPQVLTAHFTNDTVLGPRAIRDGDQPDLGWHAMALDYCWTGLKVVNARLTLTNDVAIGVYGGGSSYGLGLDSGAELRAMGRPHRPARLVRYALVQGSGSNAWSSTTAAPLIQVLTNGPVEPRMQVRFLELAQAGGEGKLLHGWQSLYNDPFGGRDCHLAGGGIQCSDVGIALTNCVLEGVLIEYEANHNDAVRFFRQNLFRGGRIDLSLPSGGWTTFTNNFFDGTTFTLGGTVDHGYNGYFYQGTNSAIQPTNATERFVTTVSYERGPLGWYYYPTNGGAGSLTDLVNKGSTNAHLLGFSYFTGATNQTKEGVSIIDIGSRFMAVNALGEPLDTDGDGLPDYLEDLDGDGDVNGGETNWNGYNSLFGLSGTPGLEVFTPLK